MNLYQVDEGQEFPAASVRLVSWHVQGFVVTQDGEIRQQDGDPENLRGDERHDAPRCLRLLCPTPLDPDASVCASAAERSPAAASVL